MFNEDLSLFFDEKDFAVEAILNLGTSTRSIKAIFETPTQSVEIYDTAIEADAPRVTCRTQDLTGIKRGHAVTVQNQSYKIEKISHDGTGLSFLYLNK